jgi:hypothetical protein
VAEHTQQKAPKDFKPQVGATPPKGIKIDVMPQVLARQLPVLKEYGYSKTASDILVIDPMSKRIVAVIPRKYPDDANAKSPTPAEWAQSHAQELTGRAPQGATNVGQSPEQAMPPPYHIENTRYLSISPKQPPQSPPEKNWNTGLG